MKKAPVFAAVLLAAARLAVPASAQVDGQVIYGSDDRIDLYQAKSARLKSLAGSTVALLQASSVEIQGDVARLRTEPYGPSMGLCAEEPFYEQVTAAFCSGSLVAPDVVMTAGHCVRSADDCAGVKFVFGFAIHRKGELPLSVPANDVYGCGSLLGREQTDDGADWALVKLDRPVEGRAPLKLDGTRRIADKTPLVVIGHPAGLPTKIAGGAAVRDASPNGYFVANLDTYGGNSGSAVFNARNGLVEGILVRGETDYVNRGGCRVSNVCASDACRGEDVTKLDAVLDRLSGAAHEERAAALAPAMTALLDAVAPAAARP